MRVEQALIDFLRRDPGVLALTENGKMLFKGRAPSDAPSRRLHYWLVSDTPEYSLAGTDTGQPKALIRLEALGRGNSGYEDARSIIEAVKDARAGGETKLRNYTAAWMPPAAPSRLWVQNVTVTDLEAGQEEQPAAGGSKSIFIVALDVAIHYLAQ